MLMRRDVLVGALTASVWAALPAQAASWVDLGARQVSLAREVDQIAVTNSRRFFTKLRLKVTGGDIFLQSATVHFLNDTAVRYRFDTAIDEGRYSASIDLPGKGRRIRHVDLAYRRKPGGGVAVVVLQGLPV